MKTPLALISSLFFLSHFLTAQSACRQATATSVGRTQAFAVFTVSLPSQPRPFIATALIPNSNRPAGAFVFSLSMLAGSESATRVQMMPVAFDLANKGRPTIVLDRELTWPEITENVGRLQAVVLCAEQWLSAHATVKPDDWMFVGPEADVPTFEQLRAVGDNTSMTFSWGFPLAGFNEYKNTGVVLQRGLLRVALLTDFHD